MLSRRLLLGIALFSGFPAVAQDLEQPKHPVIYVAEQQSVSAKHPATIELDFQVVNGYHVNSHTPKSDFLIPTTLAVQSATSVTQGKLVYPAGQEYSFSFSPNDKLDVYSGGFTIKLPVVAAAGEHTMNATLRYQACDHAACYPPKSLPLQILFTAK